MPGNIMICYIPISTKYFKNVERKLSDIFMYRRNGGNINQTMNLVRIKVLEYKYWEKKPCTD